MRILLALLLLGALGSASSPAPEGAGGSPGLQSPLPPVIVNPSAGQLSFTLRQVFHRSTSSDHHRRRDVPAGMGLLMADQLGAASELSRPLLARSRAAQIQRLEDRSREHVDSILESAREGAPAVLSDDHWTLDTLEEPDPTDRETVLTFARIAANAYVRDETGANWEGITAPFNKSVDFGWESEGLRGHVFADENNSTIVIGLKGTSPAVFDGAETTGNDKINDNLFFSCCCGQGGQYWWKQVCDCQTTTYTCNATCVRTALHHKSRYYTAAQDLYHNVTALYPNSQVWLAGHSLGGAVSAMLGMTYGIPVFAFEAPGDAMPASRLGLPTPPGYQLGLHQKRMNTGAYHFGHTADPIFMGTCNTAGSFCTLGGYAMESVCHTGKICVYDTVQDLGWRSGIGTHRIRSVIDDVLLKYETVPVCAPNYDCVDCYGWNYFESNHSTPTTTPTTQPPTSTSTQTRTETCKTPGWWGCLDGTTTGSGTSTSSSTTSTCKTPGWFGCKDPTTAPTITSTDPARHTTTSCKTPGWFGCNDPTEPAPTTTDSEPGEPTEPEPTTTSCKTPGWFGCNDPTEPASTTTDIEPTDPAEPAPTTTSCRNPGWFGCNDPVEPTESDYPTPSGPTPVPGEGNEMPEQPTSTCATPGWWGCRDVTATAPANGGEGAGPGGEACVKVEGVCVKVDL